MLVVQYYTRKQQQNTNLLLHDITYVESTQKNDLKEITSKVMHLSSLEMGFLWVHCFLFPVDFLQVCITPIIRKIPRIAQALGSHGWGEQHEVLGCWRSIFAKLNTCLDLS